GNNTPPPIYGRINRLKIDRDDFLQKYPGSPVLARSPEFVEFHAWPTDALNLGRCYIQDPSTAVASELLDPQPGEKILDACAAPGGKTSYLAELMQNRGILLACDRDASRLMLLRENLARLGATIAQIVRQDWSVQSIAKQIL